MCVCGGGCLGGMVTTLTPWLTCCTGYTRCAACRTTQRESYSRDPLVDLQLWLHILCGLAYNVERITCCCYLLLQRRSARAGHVCAGFQDSHRCADVVKSTTWSLLRSFISAVLVVRLVVGLHELVVVASVLMFPRARTVVWSVVSDRVWFCGHRWCALVVG